jgi:hypothetical protein
MDIFGFELGNNKYQIEILTEVYIIFGIIGILMLSLYIYIIRKAKNKEKYIKYNYSV